jgi:hypothetical protein
VGSLLSSMNNESRSDQMGITGTGYAISYLSRIPSRSSNAYRIRGFSRSGDARVQSPDRELSYITLRFRSLSCRTSASAQSVEQVARLSRNVRQPDHVLANQIAGHKAEPRPGAGEEWLAATKHDGVEVESILINKTQVG